MSGEAEVSAALARLERGARLLLERHFFLLFSHHTRFANPLVPEERERLRSAPWITDEAIHLVVEEVLLAGAARRCAAGAPPSIFFPVPLARSIAGGERLEAALERFHYELIHVDQDHRWTWRGASVASRTREFFLEHTRWEPSLARFVFEFRVNDQWWDKSYLEAEVTPFLAVALEEADDEVRVVLQDGRRVAVPSGESCRLDQRERLYLPCAQVAEALCTEALRFRLLRGADESLRTIAIGDRRVPLLGAKSAASGAPRPPG
ncbi:MAG TPA: hypothetical protein VNB06_02025 [Thermoanaerobaculia bacterium]|nr:hypothetical protein [Thermoanaerobaculia bacterium]